MQQALASPYSGFSFYKTDLHTLLWDRITLLSLSCQILLLHFLLLLLLPLRYSPLLILWLNGRTYS